MKLSTTTGNRTVESAPSRFAVSLPPSASAGGTSSIAKCAVGLNPFGAALAGQADGTNLSDVQTVFNHRPPTKLCPDGDHRSSKCIETPQFFPELFESAPLAACAYTAPKRDGRDNLLNSTSTAHTTGRAKPDCRPFSFRYTKVVFNYNPLTKLGSNGDKDRFCIRSRWRYTPWFRQVIHLAPLRLLGCVPPILFNAADLCQSGGAPWATQT